MQIRIRRSAAAGLAAALAVGALVGCSAGTTDGAEGSSEFGSEPLVVASWGGSFDEGLQKAYFDDFTADTGVEVIIAPADWAKFVAMNEAGASEWNAVDAADATTLGWVDKGYIAAMPEGIERSDILSDAVADYMPGGYLNSFLTVYRKDAFSTAPSGWADFWDTEKFPGKRAMVGIHEGMVEAALLADGVAPEDLYPLDFDRGFAKLSELKDHLLITTGYAELRQAIDTGQVDYALMPSGSAARSVLASEGALEISWEQNILTSGGFPFSVSGPNQAAAEKLMEYMQDPERQAEFTNISYYGSAMSAAQEFIDPEMLPYVGTYDVNREQAVFVDEAWLGANQDEYVDRFSEWLTQ